MRNQRTDEKDGDGAARGGGLEHGEANKLEANVPVKAGSTKPLKRCLVVWLVWRRISTWVGPPDGAPADFESSQPGFHFVLMGSVSRHAPVCDIIHSQRRVNYML